MVITIEQSNGSLITVNITMLEVIRLKQKLENLMEYNSYYMNPWKGIIDLDD